MTKLAGGSGSAVGKYLKDTLRLREGLERIAFILFIFSITCHITSCMWYLVANLEASPNSWPQRYSMQDYSETEVKKTCHFNLIISYILYAFISL
jgi:hypothetical protein